MTVNNIFSAAAGDIRNKPLMRSGSVSTSYIGEVTITDIRDALESTV